MTLDSRVQLVLVSSEIDNKPMVGLVEVALLPELLLVVEEEVR